MAGCDFNLMDTHSYTIEWTHDVDKKLSEEATVLSKYIIEETGIDPIHAVEALLVTTQFIYESAYCIHSHLSALNFPQSLVSSQKISTPLLFFKLLISREMRKHFAWLCHLKENMVKKLYQRPFTSSEKAVFPVVQWFHDLMGVAPLITWVHGTRPDIHRVTSHASRLLYLVYHSHENIEHAIHQAANPVWNIASDGEFLEIFVSVANDAKMCMAMVEWPDANATPDVIVHYKTTGVGLVCSPKDKILLLMLLLFSDKGDLLRQKATGTPSCIATMASHIAHCMKSGARGPIQFY